MKKSCLTLAAMAFTLAAIPAAHASGGPYVVDDAGITDPGEFKLESWASRANGGDQTYVIAPGFTPASLPFAEFEIGLERRRTGGDWETGFAPAVKFAARDVDADGFGLALVAGTTHAGTLRRTETAFAVIPLTIAATDRLHLHVNAGVERDFDAGETAGLWGLAAQGFVNDRLEVIGEVFGAQNARTGWQAGLRPIVLNGSLALDFAYGRNLDGERGDWLTFGISTGF
jgi:hypothetical protein